MLNIFDTLNSAFTLLASAYIYLVAIAFLVCFVQSLYARHINANAVSNEHYEQVKVLMTVEPETSVAFQGKALSISVEREIAIGKDVSEMGIRAIRNYIRENSWQQEIRDRLSKSVSKCSLAELRHVVEDILCDLRFEQQQELKTIG